VEYDLILLDMNMQEKNGIEVAKELRSQKIETPIIYISAYIEMAPYGYVVNAFRYLLKNDLEETFCFAMDDVMKELKHHLETIEVRTENVQIELRLSDIVFVESYKRYVLIRRRTNISNMARYPIWKKCFVKKNFCGYTKVISSI
jgi:two-component system response regulator LytT